MVSNCYTAVTFRRLNKGLDFIMKIQQHTSEFFKNIAIWLGPVVLTFKIEMKSLLKLPLDLKKLPVL